MYSNLNIPNNTINFDTLICYYQNFKSYNYHVTLILGSPPGLALPCFIRAFLMAFIFSTCFNFCVRCKGVDSLSNFGELGNFNKLDTLLNSILEMKIGNKIYLVTFLLFDYSLFFHY